MIKHFLVILIITFSISSKCQSYTIPASGALKHLFQSKSEIGKIGGTENLVLFPLIIGNRQAKFKLIKDVNGLFAIADGTGQVYKATTLKDSKITFTRIDSSHFYGNNFESINFSYNGRIYNYGGYGFWNRSGQLSHFTNGSEWSIDKINKQFSITNKFYSYIPQSNKLYTIQFPWEAEATFDKISAYSVIELDIKKKETKNLGKLNPKINPNNIFTIDLPSLGGVLDYNERKLLLYNFSSNKVYKLSNQETEDKLIGKAGKELQVSFEDNGRIYFTFKNDTILNSIAITMNDFKEESYPIYIHNYEEYYNWIIFFGVIAIGAVISLLIYIKRKRKTSTLNSLEQFESQVFDIKSNDFNSIEFKLIENLIEKSSIDSHLTVDELNTYLGLKKKSIEIQKRVRTEAINRINHKFNVNFDLETIFIERIRSAEDRRYFNYIINNENAKFFQSKFK